MSGSHERDSDGGGQAFQILEIARAVEEGGKRYSSGKLKNTPDLIHLGRDEAHSRNLSECTYSEGLTRLLVADRADSPGERGLVLVAIEERGVSVACG